MKANHEFERGQWRSMFGNPIAIHVCLLLMCLAVQSPAQSYKILHTFGTNVMGLNPHSALVQGPEGALYGTTEAGGAANHGQVFKVNADGTGYTALKDFSGPDGAWPEAGLLISGTTLYGTTSGGGTNNNGTVFKINTDGSGFTVLKYFTGYDGGNPQTKLTLSGTVLYGTSVGGGAFWDGTVFKVNTDGSDYVVLKHFSGNIDGGWPFGGLVLFDSTLYGTANGGGSYGGGVVFKVNTDGSGFAVLRHFTGVCDGSGPCAGVVLSGASLYGTTSSGGLSGSGTVFKLNVDGSGFNVLKHFTGYDGACPYADLVMSGLSLYGTTANGGTNGNGVVFKVETDGSGFTVLKDFTNSKEGVNISAGLLLTGTTLYGSAYYGGAEGYGSTFKLGTDGSSFLVLRNFGGGDGVNPAGGLLLSGTNFYGATFNGGAAGMGTLFRVNLDGTGYMILKDFTNSLEGQNPREGLMLSGTALYGTTGNGGISGNGVIFKINTDGTGYNVLRDFTNQMDGAGPNGSLILSESVLYGTTTYGGNNGYGTVFSLHTDGAGFTVLHSFSWGNWDGSSWTNADGTAPQSGLVLSGGMLYGTAWGGGTNGYGTIFKLSTNGTDFAVIKHFMGNDAANPSGHLSLFGGTLYGTTFGGGSGYGTVFKMNKDGNGFEVLKTFSGLDGASPQGWLAISGSALYGTTAWGGLVNNGNLFQLGTDGSNFSVLKHFTGGDGNSPNGGLVLDGTTLYGTTVSGSTSDSGVLFGLSLLPSAPEIQLQPLTQTPHLHWSVSFVVAAGGIPAPAYQWFFNGNFIDGATNGLLQLTDVQGAQAGGYYVVVTNGLGSVTSLVATLSVEDPFINSQPSSQYGQAGVNVSFYVDAGGTDPLTFQWFKNGVSLTDGGNVSGSQTTTLTLTNVTGADAGWFSVLVTNVSGSITSVPVMLVVQDPFINSQPSDQFVNAGDTAQFSVNAGGTVPLGYQWFKDGLSLNDGGNISGAQTATLTLSNVAGVDAGGYSVTISNLFGTVLSITAQLTVNQALADSFNPGADAGVAALAVQADGRVLVGGWFSSLGEPGRSALGRLNIDGTTDFTFNPGFQGAVSCLGILPDGKILVGGDFIPPGQTNLHLARLDPNGSLDPTFHPEVDSTVECMALQADGKILLGGEFTVLDGQTNNYIGRLNADGTLDTNFTAQADGVPSCIAIQPDGKILVGGGFSVLDGQTRINIGRLNADGTLDTAFNPGASSGVCTLVLQSDGKILAAGDFMTLGGRDAYHLGRLNADGTPDISFNPQANADVVTLGLQTDGKIVLGGWFVTLNNQPRNAVGRLMADGSLDTAFNPGADGAVRCLAVQADGKVVLGGEFGALAGQPRSNVGRVINPEPTTESLTFDGSIITWLRGGSAPEVWRTTFEVSTNSAEWFTLGEGARSAGGWELTGISASPSANLRARGFVPGSGASSWFVESIIGAPAIVTQPNSAAKLAGADVSFPVFAGGTPPLAYQWFKDGLMLSDGANISGAHSPTLVLTSVYGSDAGGYFVTVSNVFGSVTSVVATLTVQDPFIATQPLGQTVLLGSNATFRAQAVGTAPLAYQWQLNGTNLVDSARITGSQQPTLAIANVQSSDDGDYHLVVSNMFGQVITSTATLTVVTHLQLPLVYDIQAFIDGRDQLVFRGNTLQWFHYDNAAVGRWEGHNEPTIMSTSIGGQSILTNLAWVPTWPEPPPAEIRYPTNSSLFTGLAPAFPATENMDWVLTPVVVRGAVTVVQTPSATNDFAFVIEFDDNPIGGADWYHISLAVSLRTPEPVISVQPQSCTNAAGTDAQFSVVAAGTPPLRYQWFKGETVLSNGGNASGAQSPTLTLSNVFGVDAAAYFVIITNTYGSVTSQVATLTVADPFITTQPVSRSANAGSSVQFSVVAGGSLPLGYQWFKNGSVLSDGGNISGVHSTVLTLNNVSGGDGGGYSVAVTNAFGSVTSQVAILVVGDPFITTQPISRSANAGANVQFSVVAGGTLPLGYQWFKNGSALSDGGNISGVHSTVLTLNNVLGGDAGSYSVLVTNAFGSITSGVAMLTVVGDPFIMTQPVSQSANAGTSVQFSVKAGGTPPLGYQWLKNGSILSDGGNVSGAHTATLTLNNVLGPDAGGYSVIVSSSYGSATSHVATLTVVGAPVITSQPADQIVPFGGTASFTVGAMGASPLQYQWFFNGSAVADASGSQLQLANVQFSQSGAYSVVVTNAIGSATSAPALLTVELPYAVLHDFTGSTNDGGGPRAGLLVWGRRLYGTTCSGGSNNWGTVFGINENGSGYSAIHGFSITENRWPQGRLVLCGSSLFGTTTRLTLPIRGTLFRLNSDGSAFVVLKSFTNWLDGLGPMGTLAVSGTTLFGTARLGGSSTASGGTAFKVNSDGSGFTVLKNFGDADGVAPFGGLVVSGTTLYGTTSSGGTSNCGTVFKLNTDGSDYAVLQNFSGGDGQSPQASLTLAGEVLYGTTANGGAYSNGTVFRINVDGTGFAVLKHFSGSDGANPYGDLVLVGTNLYGTTYSGGMFSLGTVFQLNTDGTGFRVIKHFSGADGANPNAGLALSGTVLYGTASTGGAFNQGVVFGLGLPVAPIILSPPGTQTAEAGTRVQLSVGVSGSPPLAYQWWFNGAALVGATTSTLEFPAVALADAGTYAVVITNALGAVTSPPAMLQVIAPVERRPVPAIGLIGDAGSVLNLDYANSIAPTPNWLLLDTVSLTGTSQLYFDITAPMKPERYYRASQRGTPVMRPSLNLSGIVPAITLTGNTGDHLRLDYINQFGPIDAWVTLDTITLTNSSQLYFDVTSIGQSPRLYRIIPVP